MGSSAPQSLVDAATGARARAHCPYSGYHVGAAIRTGSGTIISGCNVENASYPLGTSAEAGAIAAMVLAGEHEIAELTVVTDGEVPGTPCGGCRQRIREFARPDVLIHSVSATGEVLTRRLDELLPHSFGPEFLQDRSEGPES